MGFDNPDLTAFRDALAKEIAVFEKLNNLVPRRSGARKLRAWQPRSGLLVVAVLDLDYEKTIFEEFRQRAVPFLSHEPRGDLEWLFLAQHYGVPTRLLDWTANPLAALYFACEKYPERECAVYKILMNKWYTSFDPIDPFQITQIAGLRPQHTDVRYINQAGAFTIHPEPTKPLEWPMGKNIISPKIKEEMRWQLRKMGIHSTFIYPSLDSVSRDIIHEHEVILNGGHVRASGPFFEF